MKISVFIADDHAVVRDGLRLLLQAETDIAIVGEAGNGREAVAEIRRLAPHVGLIDIAMPELNGIEAARQIRERSPLTKVLILSMYGSSEHFHRARQAGAMGFVVKESAGADLVTAIRSVHAGQPYWSEALQVHLEDASWSVGSQRGEKSPVECLSGREREILQLVVEGKTSAAIAADLGLSPKTVETYRSRLMTKLGVRNIPDLVKFAVQHVLTPPTVRSNFPDSNTQ